MTADPELEGVPTRAIHEVVDTQARRWVFRHPLVIRVSHWINAVCLVILLMSGLQIFNAHPSLYWGKDSAFTRPVLSIGAADTDGDNPKGVTTVLGHAFTTTGVLGYTDGGQGENAERGFPSWVTLPGVQDLATGRRWHFFFAWLFVGNGLVYVLYGLMSGQLKHRLIPTGDQMRRFGQAVIEHLTLHFPGGEEAKRYNVIQKLTYLAVVGVLLPLQILAGIAMSPGLDSVVPWLLPALGGRQSARTIHFIVADLLLLFLVVHVVLVLVSGFWNNMRGMVTGWFVIERKKKNAPAPT